MSMIAPKVTAQTASNWIARTLGAEIEAAWSESGTPLTPEKIGPAIVAYMQGLAQHAAAVDEADLGAALSEALALGQKFHVLSRRGERRATGDMQYGPWEIHERDLPLKLAERTCERAILDSAEDWYDGRIFDQFALIPASVDSTEYETLAAPYYRRRHY
ncbi:hypothetical protein [Rhodomicrobium udaipurense]|uniref:Uncharacterized protein n=1 Tax=Rhodomicrobium udaipurense TaxID=1202716 RepID=A0A8I1GG83_9HYPH|nr:hypothetical protein [Rhodomicrobium udaipurense]MBJ7543291.1 hypothetical protein [Rhodomicrobium udaipurense]